MKTVFIWLYKEENINNTAPEMFQLRVDEFHNAITITLIILITSFAFENIVSRAKVKIE